MVTSMDHQCKECLYHRVLTCFRYPQTVSKVPEADCCGEFFPREQPKPTELSTNLFATLNEEPEGLKGF